MKETSHTADHRAAKTHSKQAQERRRQVSKKTRKFQTETNERKDTKRLPLFVACNMQCLRRGIQTG
jgi:hypothetical protein